MKLTNQELINDLAKRTKANLKAVESLKEHPIEELNRKATSESWSALECVEHLNRYGDFYLPEIKKQLRASPKMPVTTVFKSGLIGNYFANSLMHKEGMKTMKTFKDMNPNGSELSAKVLDLFIDQQKEMLEILARCVTQDLRKTKTAISISSLIKLRLGDTLRVVIYHNDRHLLQANRAVE